MNRNFLTQSILFCAICFFCATLSAEPFYIAQDLGTLGTVQSHALSINQAGMIAGKFSDDENSADFIWTPETGLQVITMEADQKTMPRINNKGQVVGFLHDKSKASWWNDQSKQIYIYDPETGLRQLGFVRGWYDEKTTNIIGFNDDGYILFANHQDPNKANCFAIYDKDQFLPFQDKLALHLVAMNNHSDILMSVVDKHWWSFGLLDIIYTGMYNYATPGKGFPMTEDTVYYALNLNDLQQVVLKDEKGNKGYLWGHMTGLIDLGDFIPVALNNAGDIVGHKEKAPYVRMKDGQMLNLAEVVDTSLIENFQEFINVGNINDLGQIVGTAKINGKEHAVLLLPISN